jgi:signal transduction histidine kinase
MSKHEQQISEEALQRTIGLLQGITQGTEDLIAAQDSEFRYIFFNEAYKREFKRLWGREIEIGTNGLEALSPWPRQMAKARELGTRALNGESFSITMEFGSGTPENRFYNIQFNPIYDAQGRQIGAAHIFRNITEQIRIEKALRESEERYRLVNRATNDIIWDWNLINDQIIWNLELGAKPGLERVIMPGTLDEWSTFVHPDDRDRVLKGIAGAIENGMDAWSDEYRIEVAGSYRAYLDRGYIARDSRGKAYRMIGSMLDLTERRRSEEALLREREIAERERSRLQTVLEILPVSVIIANADGQIIAANPAADEIWDKVERSESPSDYGEDYKAWWPGTGRRVKAEEWGMARTLSTGERCMAEARTGRRKTILNYSIPILNATGDITGGVAVNVDITEHKKVAQSLLVLNETLERKVAERTELAEAQAQQLRFLTVELIEAEERERRRIAEILHDDLQQILASAKIQLQAVSQNIPPLPGLAEVDHLLKQSIEKSRRLSHELSPAVVYHSGLYTALKWLVSQVKDQFGLDVRLDADAAHQIKGKLNIFVFRAVQELLFNVAKHSGVNSAHVGFHVSDKDLNIVVTDQGNGFNPEILKSSDGKSGLGLLSLRERIRTIGGNLHIDSVPGEGTRTALSIPLESAGAGEMHLTEFSPGTAPVLSANKEDLIGGEDIRVLLADDHKVMRQGLMSMIAGQKGIRVVGEAANGLEAIEQVEVLKPNLVIMDVSMPKMGGVEATRKIRSRWPEVRVIGLSMLMDDHIVSSMRNAGADAFLTKTASLAELLKTIYGV